MIEVTDEIEVILALVRGEPMVRWVYNAHHSVSITFNVYEENYAEIDDNGVMYTPEQRPYMATSQHAMRLIRTVEAVGQALACVPRGNLAAMGGERALAEAYHKVAVAEEYIERHVRNHNIVAQA